MQDAPPASVDAEDRVPIDPPHPERSRVALDALTQAQAQGLDYLSFDRGARARDAKHFSAEGFWLERVIPLEPFSQPCCVYIVSGWQCIEHNRSPIGSLGIAFPYVRYTI